MFAGIVEVWLLYQRMRKMFGGGLPAALPEGVNILHRQDYCQVV